VVIKQKGIMIKRAALSFEARRTSRRVLGSTFASFLIDESCLFLYKNGC
jgi:hypothetical protein